MAYDEGLADRVRELLAAETDLTEQRMFGGLAFLLSGNMAVAINGDGLMVRVDPEEAPRLTETGPATPMEMGGRRMSGWVLLPADAIRTARQLQRWVDRGVARSRTFPPKARRRSTAAG